MPGLKNRVRAELAFRRAEQDLKTAVYLTMKPRVCEENQVINYAVTECLLQIKKAMREIQERRILWFTEK